MPSGASQRTEIILVTRYVSLAGLALFHMPLFYMTLRIGLTGPHPARRWRASASPPAWRISCPWCAAHARRVCAACYRAATSRSRQLGSHVARVQRNYFSLSRLFTLRVAPLSRRRTLPSTFALALRCYRARALLPLRTARSTNLAHAFLLYRCSAGRILLNY